jgi:tyrosyl-tRNA synthetase
MLNKNIAGIKSQLEHFLDFDSTKPNAALMTNNYDWFKKISFIARYWQTHYRKLHDGKG